MINNGEGGWVGEDGGESSEIFDYSIEPSGTILLRPSTECRDLLQNVETLDRM